MRLLQSHRSHESQKSHGTNGSHGTYGTYATNRRLKNYGLSVALFSPGPGSSGNSPPRSSAASISSTFLYR